MKAYSSWQKAPKPLGEQQLEQLALRYVERFATTRAKLAAYLSRKIRERGWDDTRDPDPKALAERLSKLGYVDDETYALAKARSLTGRGYGKRRVADALRQAGVSEEDGQSAHEHAGQAALSAALRLAERRRIGPFASAKAADPRAREKAIAAMVRAGHSFDLARAIVDWPAGTEIDVGVIADRARLTDM